MLSLRMRQKVQQSSGNPVKEEEEEEKEIYLAQTQGRAHNNRKIINVYQIIIIIKYYKIMAYFRHRCNCGPAVSWMNH